MQIGLNCIICRSKKLESFSNCCIRAMFVRVKKDPSCRNRDPMDAVLLPRCGVPKNITPAVQCLMSYSLSSNDACIKA